MRVFFTASRTSSPASQRFIDEVLRVLERHKTTIITLEDDVTHQHASGGQSLEPPRKQYAFTTKGIAEADIVIVEASSGDFRIGHEVTLALLYSKPVLVLSRNTNYSDYISHQLFFGEQYQTTRELRSILDNFLDKAHGHISLSQKSAQTIYQAADMLHAAALSSLRQSALRDQAEFGELGRLAEKDPEKAYKKVIKTFGELPVQPAWSAFAPIYNEDTPDYVFEGVANFVHGVLAKAGISSDRMIVDVDTKTGSLARNLVARGYTAITAVESSREMLAETFRLCARIPTITIIESSVANLHLPQKADAITWMDFSSNFALTQKELQSWLKNLLANIRTGGRLLLDVRTRTGWDVSFFRRKVSTTSSPYFQRISIHDIDHKKSLVHLDRFIRTKNVANNAWNEWRREQMTERMWTLQEIKAIVSTLDSGRLKAVYDDNFIKADTGEEPGLAYLEIIKI